MLVELLASADDLHITVEDRSILVQVMREVSGILFSQLAVASHSIEKHRREAVLTSLGIRPRQIPGLLPQIPVASPHLCGDSFTTLLQAEIDGEKQARDLSVAFRDVQKPVPSSRPRRKSSKSSGSSRKNVGQSKGRPQDWYPVEEEYQDRGRPSSRDSSYRDSSFRGASSRGSTSREKGAIEEVDDHPCLCLSPVFVIPKRSGSLRMILNMKRINLHLGKVHFRMDHLATILPSLNPADVAVSLDLRDAYFHIPIHPLSRDLLGFAFLGKFYRYRVLPFGLRPAPRIFTRVVASVMAFLRRRGLRLFAYLDDWLLVANSEALLLDHVQILISTTQDLGFLINLEKSEFVPTRTPSYLGAQLDIRHQLACPSFHRVETIVRTARSLRCARRVKAERWLQWLGYLSSLVDVLPDCRLLMRPFQFFLLEFYQPGVSSLLTWIPLSSRIKGLLGPWLRRSFLLQGKRFRVPLPSVTVTTDASLLGWGGHCQGSMISGDWSHLDFLPHFNVLELMGVFAPLRHFRARLVGRSVLILTDNVSVMAYINRQGGTHSVALNELASQLWAWCKGARVFPIASHIPGEENIIADFLSRGKCLPSEWTLSPTVFRQLVRVFGVLDIDLFATLLNHRGDSVVVAMSSGSGVATSVRYSTPAAGYPPSDRLAVIGERARSSGFSERAAQFLVQSRRESTRTVYNSRLDAFHTWCEEVGVAPREASLPSIADFLISLFDKGRALSMIRGYRSAIAAVHSGFADGTSVSSAPQLAALLKSFSLKRPFFRPLTPALSLPKVLEALARPPFEPLCSATLLHTTIKTVFLMAIASGQRRSSLHALSVAPGHIRWEGRGVRLIPKASFIAKNQSDTSGSVEVVLHPLSDLSSVSGDKLWCPVRALKWYLHKTKPFSKLDQLFLVSREPHSAASRDTISRWLVLAIKAAGPEALTPGRTPRAHDTRSVSTSWALFNGVSVRDICKAAFWKSPSSFTAFYLKDVPAGERAFAVASLKAASSSISH
ncbi:uncharacterized protein LOC115921380 [Strongylocentrotus purpuratus]|uniref:Reverse transcriptase domain-containing protein n=1 Tax=Strongylocentrotus purpuratus TaxID=7668 RepID=A0A7M7NDD2_STRPU|nr:uncharacterized protein LOC115921380 [Strongylocentrotus purpuratus]